MAYNPVSGEDGGDKKPSHHSSGGGYNPVSGSTSSGKKKKSGHHKPKKKHHHGGLLGLGENLIHDVGDLAAVPAGLWNVTKVAAHDAKDAVDGGGHDYHLDDIGRETLKGMAYTYAPLVHGDVGEFGKRVYEHPLGPVLDMLTVATLGAGGAVRGAKLVGDVGEAGSVAAKLTGGSVRKLAEGEDGALAMDRLRAGRARGQRGAGALSRDGKSILEPSPRLLTTKAQKATDRLPSALSRHSKDARVEGGGITKVGEYAENPIRRLQQKAYDAITEATGLSDLRIAHEQRKLARNRATRRTQAAGVNKAASTVRGKEISPELGRAFLNQSVVGHADDVEGMAATKLEQMAKDLERIGSPEKDAREARVVQSVVGKKKGEHATGAAAEALGVTTSKLNEAVSRKSALDAAKAGVDDYNSMLDDLDNERAMTHGDPEVEQVDLNQLLEKAVTPNPEGKLVPVHEAATDEQIARAGHLKDDITEYGFDSPIDVIKGKDGRLVVTDGVSRLLAAAENGREAVPVRLSKTTMTHGTHGVDLRTTGSRFSRPSENGLIVHDRPASLYKKQEEAQAAVSRKIEKLGERKKTLTDAVMNGVDNYVDDRKQILTMADSPAKLEQMHATIKVQRNLMEKGLEPDDMKALNVLLEVMRPVVEGEGGTDSLLQRQAELQGKAGPRNKADRGIEDDGFSVTRQSNRNQAERAGKQSAANRSGGPTRKPDASRKTEGFNERFGLESADPKNVVTTHEAVNRFNQSLDVWRTGNDAMRDMEPGTAPPKGWSEVPQGVATRFLKDARAFLDDEAPVIYGDDLPALEQARQVILEDFGNRFSRGPQMIPTKLLRHLEREMSPQGRLPLIDNLTGLWRATVVSPLRPAFVVNNILGQTALLGVAHGGLGTMRGIMHNAKYGEDLNHWNGAVIGSGQSAALMRETSRLLNNEGKFVGKVRDANEAMGRVSQAITDDPYRRIAFAQEAIPPARKILKRAEAEGKTVVEDGVERPYMMRDALKDLLDHEPTLDRIERKVLDDLVDFDDLTHTERAVVRRIAPFYSWIKGSGKLTLKLIGDNPAFANLMYRVGQHGHEVVNREAGGALPDYMMGLLDLNDISKKTGIDSHAFTTAQFNPFVTPSDTLSQLGFLLGIRDKNDSAFNPDNPLSQTNPLVKAAVAGLTGKDPFSGRDMTPFQVAATSFPLIGSYGLPGDALGVTGNADQKDGIYGHSKTNEILKYVGAPIRQNVNADKAVAMEENPYQTVEVHGHEGSQFFVGPDGRLYMDIGKPKPKKKKKAADK